MMNDDDRPQPATDPPDGFIAEGEFAVLGASLQYAYRYLTVEQIADVNSYSEKLHLMWRAGLLDDVGS